MEETFPTQPNPVYTPASAPESPKHSRFLPIAIFIVVVIVLIFGGVRLLGSKNSKTTSQITTTPTPTPYQFPTDTPTPSPQATTPTPTTKPTINPVDSATGLDRSTLAVSVKNGSGVTGAASKASDVLKGFGYHIVAIGNADNENYIDITIQVKSTKSNFLPLLKKDLGFSYTVGSTSADLASDSATDALVIIGK